MKPSKPSATAALILKAVLFTARDSKNGFLVSPEAARLSRQMVLHVFSRPKLFLFLIKNALFRWILKTIEGLFNPGFILHVAARKRLIDRLGVEAINKGCKQVVIVGAGYDTFGMRTATAFKDVNCFEVDHPQTQESKRSSFSGQNIPPNCYFIAADLSVDAISQVLQTNPKFDVSKSTLVVIEGVLMYLPARAVEKLLKDLLSLLSGGVICVFTFMNRQPNGEIQFQTAHPLVNWWLKQKNEPFFWGIEKDELVPYMKKIGFRDATVFGKSEMIKEFFCNDIVTHQVAEG